ncbi:hypothetical protein Scep_010349 [Stephania cephalantha]|uniref:Uncharacterized protein n=1 Tax=Stephania cephalantha TaxID=152367 RepID=A0AAP0JUV5_9MAGN
MNDPLFDLYYDVPSAKELWEKFEARYHKEDATRERRKLCHRLQFSSPQFSLHYLL